MRKSVLLLLAVAVIAGANAQPKGKPAVAFQPTAIDRTWEQLPATFVASDPSRLADWIERTARVSAPADKFTKSSDVSADQQAMEARMSASGPLGFYLRRDPDGVVRERDTCRLAYDADRELLSFNLPYLDYPQYKHVEQPTANHRKVTVKSSVKDNDGYAGTNAYGAQVEVSRVQYTEISVAEPRGGASGTGGSLSIAPERARALYDRLGCLVIFEPLAPFYFLSNDTRRPTLSSPIQISTNDRVLFGRIVSVWLVDLQARTVLQKADR